MKQKTLSLYHQKWCSYCVVTRNLIRTLGIDIDLRDTGFNPVYRKELIRSGGKHQVPCLKIEVGDSVEWLYESTDIAEYLMEYCHELRKSA